MTTGTLPAAQRVIFINSSAALVVAYCDGSIAVLGIPELNVLTTFSHHQTPLNPSSGLNSIDNS